MTNYKYIEEPENWPYNDKEVAIQRVYDALTNFIENPNYETKEIIMSLCIQNDINEFSSKGWFRNTEYEISMYNEIYFLATVTCMHSVKIFLYRCLYEMVVSNKMINMMTGEENNYLEIANNLCLPLRLFYFSYFNMRQFKNGYFVDDLINVVDIWLKSGNVDDVQYALLNFVHDISYNKSKKAFPILSFNRRDPDFVLTNINKDKLKPNILVKTKAIARNDYIFCDNCLQVSYDDVLDKPKSCKICGADIKIIKK